MNIHATQRLEVNITPINAAKALLKQFLRHHEWVVEEEGCYSIYYECSAGSHSFDKRLRGITKNEYEFIRKLQDIVQYLEEKETENIINQP